MHSKKKRGQSWLIVTLSFNARRAVAMNQAHAKITVQRQSIQKTTESIQTDCTEQKGKVSPYSISERRVPELIPVLGSQPAGDVSHKPGGRLPLLSGRPAVTLATLKSFAAW